MAYDSKVRWVPVGAAWRDRKGDGFRISLSLGLLGEISCLMKPNNRKTHDGQPDFTLVLQASNLLLNRLLGTVDTGDDPEFAPRRSYERDAAAVPDEVLPPPSKEDIPF